MQDFRVHYLPSHVRLSAFLQGTDFNAANGIQGFAGLQRPGTISSFPDYAFSGYAALQGSAFDQRPKSQDRTVFEPTDNFTILKGRHSLKFGVLVRYYQWIGYDSSNYAGIFTFSGSETQSSALSGGDSFADFLLGYPASVARAYPGANFGGQRWYHQYFAHDDIHVNEKLTVNVGLRYEYSPWLNGYKGQLGTFDPTKAKPIIVEGNTSQVDLTSQYAAPAAYQFFGQYIQTSSQAGLPYSITYTDRTQFGPRIGFAWRPLGNDTVVRGGFGIFYEPEGTSGRVNRNILPFLLLETVNQTQNVVPTRTTANFFHGAPYPFGHGLSYTQFKYSNLKLLQTKAAATGTVEVSFDLQNAGTRAGSEVAQLYVHQARSNVVQPIKSLRGFQRVTLEAGETARRNRASSVSAVLLRCGYEQVYCRSWNVQGVDWVVSSTIRLRTDLEID